MIIAVRPTIRWMFAAALLVAFTAVAFTGCGSPKSGNAPPASSSQSRSAESIPALDPVPVAKAQDVRPSIVAFGDSLSAGFGLDPGQSFPDEMQRLLDKGGYVYQVINMGVSGDTTTDGVERLPSVLALKPAVVLLEFGGNDGLRGLPVASTKANLAQMTDALQKAGAKVVIAGMTLPRNYGLDYIRPFERLYVDVAKQYRAPLIPFLLDGVGGHPDLMQPDGIHPTAEGARRVAKIVIPYIEPILKK